MSPPLSLSLLSSSCFVLAGGELRGFPPCFQRPKDDQPLAAANGDLMHLQVVIRSIMSLSMLTDGMSRTDEVTLFRLPIASTHRQRTIHTRPDALACIEGTPASSRSGC